MSKFIPGRGARVILGWLGIFVGLAGIAGIVLDRRAADRQRELFASQAARFRTTDRTVAGTGPVDSGVTWDGQTFHDGDRVRIRKWAGTFKPADTGASVDVHCRQGHVGVVLRGERRTNTGYLRYDPKEPIQIVRVRWHPQKWKVMGRDQWIDLPEFEATIHVSHLEVVP